jgi:hypothetical protein
MPESVTYVPGMECHLCIRKDIISFSSLADAGFCLFVTACGVTLSRNLSQRDRVTSEKWMWDLRIHAIGTEMLRDPAMTDS